MNEKEKCHHEKPSDCPRFSLVEKYLQYLRAKNIKAEWRRGYGITAELSNKFVDLAEIQKLCNDALCLCTIKANHRTAVITFHDEEDYFEEP